jgi:hypothetical protein
MYSDDRINLLRREHEYTFLTREKTVEVSTQLYLIETTHWRLFAFSRRGLLLSVNLSLLKASADSFSVTSSTRHHRPSFATSYLGRS